MRCSMVTTTLVLVPDTITHTPCLSPSLVYHPVGQVYIFGNPYGSKQVRCMPPPRIMLNESSLETKQPLGRTLTLCLPALMRSASTLSFNGNGPKPRIPFSL